MSYWTAEDGLTHIVNSRERWPEEPFFGYESLCEEVHLPIEGEHFRLNDRPAAEIQYDQCQEYEPRFDFEERGFETAVWQGHFALLERDYEGEIDRLHLGCECSLVTDLHLDISGFTGDLRDEVDNLCTDCWAHYESQQWKDDHEVTQLKVEVQQPAELMKTYHANSLEAVGKQGQSRVRLTSKDGLEKEIDHDDIHQITLCESHHVVY